MSNLNSQEQFPKSFFHSKSIDRYEERAKVQSSSFLYGYQKLFTPLSAYRFVTESSHIGDTKLNRSELLYLLLVIGSYTPEYPLLSSEQENNHPDSLKIRKLYRCEKAQLASKADKLRMYFVSQGLLEFIETKGNQSNKVKIARNFFLYFCLHLLKKDRVKALKETESKRITKEDFLKRVSIEEKIAFLELELQRDKRKNTLKQEIKNKKLT